MDAKSLINSLSEQQIIKVLMELGSEEPIKKGNALAFTTVCHFGDSHKLYYYSSSKKFHCYTKCGENYNIISLTQKVKQIEFKEAINFLCDLLGFANFYVNKKVGFSNEFDDLEYLKKFKKKEKEINEIEIYKENVLNIFHKNLFYQGWINEGISIDAMLKYEISFDILENRIIIPHRNKHGELIGVKTRNINSDIKYVPLFYNKITYKYNTSLNLYGLYYNLDHIKRNKKVVIFEGEKSVLKCESYYNDNNFSVAICGSNLTRDHVSLLNSLNCIEEVIIAVDKEYTNHEEMIDYSKKIQKVFINKLLPYFNVSILWDIENLLGYKDSPADKGKIIFEKLFEKRVKINEL